jgi:hypothetical protein
LQTFVPEEREREMNDIASTEKRVGESKRVSKRGKRTGFRIHAGLPSEIKRVV